MRQAPATQVTWVFKKVYWEASHLVRKLGSGDFSRLFTHYKMGNWVKYLRDIISLLTISLKHLVPVTKHTEVIIVNFTSMFQHI